MKQEYTNFITRLRTLSQEKVDLSEMPRWMEVNMTNPLDSTKPWSFDDHEYQREIIADTTPELYAQKCSQVGFSELALRLALAMQANLANFTCIYTLPTAAFAKGFVKGRFDPVINDSALLRSLVDRDNNNTEMKQFGKSFLYIRGTMGGSSAISIPAQGLIMDETDFSHQANLSVFNSRLGHAKEGSYYKRGFSTPTVLGFGVNKNYETGSKKHYAVKCHHCNDYVFPNFMDDVVIPGWGDNFATSEWSKEHASTELGMRSVNQAYLACPVCRNEITQDTLCNPDNRIWIAEHPDREVASYQVMPYDVPAVNPIPRTLKHVTDYARYADWVNFKVGYPHEDETNAFLAERITENTAGNEITAPGLGETLDQAGQAKRPDAHLRGTFSGIDVGKTSWYVLLQPHPTEKGRFIVLYRERITQDGDGILLKRILFLNRYFGVVRSVIDAGPDFTTSKGLVTQSGGRGWACEYSARAFHLNNLHLKEDDGIVQAFRTGTLDDLARMVNGGFFIHTKGRDAETMKAHMGCLKRITQPNDKGEEVAVWIKTGDEHYAHALNYAYIAVKLSDVQVDTGVVPVLPGLSTIKIKGEVKDVNEVNTIQKHLTRD